MTAPQRRLQWRHIQPVDHEEALDDPFEGECSWCDRAPGEGYGFLRAGYVCPVCHREVEHG